MRSQPKARTTFGLVHLGGILQALEGLKDVRIVRYERPRVRARSSSDEQGEPPQIPKKPLIVVRVIYRYAAYEEVPLA